jgi:hypothetical protein
MNAEHIEKKKNTAWSQVQTYEYIWSVADQLF